MRSRKDRAGADRWHAEIMDTGHGPGRLRSASFFKTAPMAGSNADHRTAPFASVAYCAEMKNGPGAPLLAISGTASARARSRVFIPFSSYSNFLGGGVSESNQPADASAPAQRF